MCGSNVIKNIIIEDSIRKMKKRYCKKYVIINYNEKLSLVRIKTVKNISLLPNILIPLFVFYDDMTPDLPSKYILNIFDTKEEALLCLECIQ